MQGHQGLHQGFQDFMGFSIVCQGFRIISRVFSIISIISRASSRVQQSGDIDDIKTMLASMTISSTTSSHQSHQHTVSVLSSVVHHHSIHIYRHIILTITTNTSLCPSICCQHHKVIISYCCTYTSYQSVHHKHCCTRFFKSSKRGSVC